MHVGCVLLPKSYCYAYIAVYLEPFLEWDFIPSTILVLFQVSSEQYGLFYKLPK
jgi:hypothetical protein